MTATMTAPRTTGAGDRSLPSYPEIARDLVTSNLFDITAAVSPDYLDEDDLAYQLAATVPAGMALRYKPSVANTNNLPEASWVGKKARMLVQNRIMIHTRRRGNLEYHPEDRSRIRLRPDVAAGWVAFRGNNNTLPTGDVSGA